MKIPDCPEPEIIWNPKENFAVKREYYAKTYNKKLEMIGKPEIKIMGLSLVLLEDYNEITEHFLECMKAMSEFAS